MNETQLYKINQFLNDQVMRDTVLTVLRDVFKAKSKDRDVNNLASRFMSLELLEEAEKELFKYKNKGKEEGKGSNQFGM